MKFLILIPLLMTTSLFAASTKQCASLKGDDRKKCFAQAIGESQACDNGNCTAIIDVRKPYVTKEFVDISAKKAAPSSKVKGE